MVVKFSSDRNLLGDREQILTLLKDQGLLDYDFYRKKYNSHKTDDEIDDDFVAFSALNGRSYSQNLDSMAYLLSHPDIASAGVSPYVHYMLFGKDEGRPIYDK